MLEHLAFEDPGLHADDAVGGLGLSKAVVDVGPQGVTGDAALVIGFRPSDFRAAQAAGDFDADALGAQARGRLHRALHGAAEGDPALELLGDVLGHQLRVGLRLADLDDVEVDLALGHARQILAELVDVGALLADDHARARGIDGHPALLVRTLDDDARHAGLAKALLQLLADLDVGVQQTGIFMAVREPAAVPGAIDAQAQTDRIDFLTH